MKLRRIILSIGGIGIIVYVLSRTIFSLYPFVTWQMVYQQKRLADEYIISQVGEDRFVSDFKFLPKQSYICSDRDAPAEYLMYCLAYDFIPATKINGEVVTAGAQIRNGKLLSMGLVPNCKSNPAYCDLKVTRQQALDIARQYGFQTERNDFVFLFGPDPKTGWKTWTWEIRQSIQTKNGATCTYDFMRIYVDPVTAEVSPVEKHHGPCIDVG